MIYWIIGIVLALIIGIVIGRLSKKENKVKKKDITTARINLRRIYTKYLEELHLIITKIDNMLISLEENGK